MKATFASGSDQIVRYITVYWLMNKYGRVADVNPSSKVKRTLFMYYMKGILCLFSLTLQCNSFVAFCETFITAKSNLSLMVLVFQGVWISSLQCFSEICFRKLTKFSWDERVMIQKCNWKVKTNCAGKYFRIFREQRFKCWGKYMEDLIVG